MAEMPRSVDIDVNLKVIQRDAQTAAVNTARAIFAPLGFVVRGTDEDNCWIDRLSEPDENGHRTVVSTQPATRREWIMWQEMRRIEGDLITMIAAKGAEFNLLIQRSLGLEQMITFCLTNAEELCTVSLHHREAKLRELLASIPLPHPRKAANGD